MNGAWIRKAGVVVGIVLVLAALVYKLFGSESPGAIREAFEGKLEDFLNIQGLAEIPEWTFDPAPGRHDMETQSAVDAFEKKREGYRRGKLLILDRAAGKIDDAHFELPGDLQARSPAEVGTVVWLTKEKKFRGTYMGDKDSDGRGYSHTWTLTIIDYERKQTTGFKEIHGSAPTAVKFGEGDREGGDPTFDDVNAFFERLPAR